MASSVQPSKERSAANEIGTALRHTFVYGIGGVLTKALAFLLLPFYTHYLSPRDYGVLEILDLSMSLLGMFLNMGITAALLRYYGASYSEDERRRVVGSTFVFAVLTGAMVFLIGAPLVPWATRLLLGQGVPPLYLYLSFGSFVVGYIGNIPYTYLRAKEASGTLVTYDALATAGMLALSIYFIAWCDMAILGVLLSPLLVGSMKVMLLIRRMGRDIAVNLDLGILRAVLAFGLPLILANLTMFTLNFADRFFVQHFGSLSDVGIYAVGYKFGYAINILLIQPFNMMWQARMYMVHRSPDHKRIYSEVLVLYASVLTAAGLAIGLFSREIIRTMVDARYASCEPLLAIIALSYIFLGLAYYLQLGMFLADRTGMLAQVSAVAAVLNLALDYLLIRRFGMVGAAWATALGFLALAIGSHYCSQRALRIALPIGRVGRGIGVAIGLYVVSRWIPASTLGMAVLVKGSILICFLILLRITGVVSSGEMGTLKELRDTALACIPRTVRPAWMRV